MPGGYGLDKFEKEREAALKKISHEDTKWTQPCPYDALISEMYYKGFEVAACVFKKSIVSEMNPAKVKKAKKICDDKPLLMEIFDRAIRAEYTWRTEKSEESKRRVCRHLYDLLLFLNVQDDYEWLYNECCHYFVKFFKEVQINASDNILSKVLYRFGLMLLETGGPSALACTALAEALYFCEGQLWGTDIPEDNKNNYDLQTGISIKIAEANARYAKTLVDPENFKEGVRLFDEAIKAVGKANMYRNKIKVSYYNVFLEKIQYFIAFHKAEEAMNLMKCFDRIFASEKKNKALKLTASKACELEGICAIKLQKYSHALEVLLYGLRICEKYGFPTRAASICLNLGKAHFRNMNIPQANKAMKKAGQIYRSLGDEKNITRVKYITAKLQTDTVFPEFLGLIKSTEYSAVSSLLNWSLGGVPFWDPNCVLELKDYLMVVCPVNKRKQGMQSTGSLISIPADIKNMKNTENEEVQDKYFPI